jgi:molecular chaperone GrpE (heat shock protein)
VFIRDARCGELEDHVERLEWEQKRIQQNYDSLKSELKISKESLTKAHLCIQGFVTENQRLADQLDKARAASATTHQSISIAGDRKVSVGTCTETANVAAGREEAALIREGVELARAKFQPVLATYRGRYERTFHSLAQCRHTCELLRIRMEELSDFLQQLLDSWDANETLNHSTLRHDDKCDLSTFDKYRYAVPVFRSFRVKLLNGSEEQITVHHIAHRS